MYVNGVKIHQLKAKDSETFEKHFKSLQLIRSNKIDLRGMHFPVNYHFINVSVIEDINKYLMKKHNVYGLLGNNILGFIQQLFIVLMLMLCFGRSLTIKYVSISTQQCMFKKTLIELNLGELQFYPFIISINTCSASCKTTEYKGINE